MQKNESIFLKRIGQKILDFVLPPRCIVSGDPVAHQGGVSPEVWQSFTFISDPQCNACGVPFDFSMDEEAGAMPETCGRCLKEPPYFSHARSVMRYDDASKKVILSYKHGDKMHMAKPIAEWMAMAGRDALARADIILPVPLHYWRLFRRRYNQAALLAKHLSKKSGKPFDFNVLVRVKSTQIQGHLSFGARHKNVRNAFAIAPHARAKIEGRRVLLIDDVFTTGATVNECAKTLLEKGGASAVDVLTFARVVKY